MTAAYLLYGFFAVFITGVAWIWSLHRQAEKSYQAGLIQGNEDATEFWSAAIKGRDIVHNSWIRSARATGEAMNVRHLTEHN